MEGTIAGPIFKNNRDVLFATTGVFRVMKTQSFYFAVCLTMSCLMGVGRSVSGREAESASAAERSLETLLDLHFIEHAADFPGCFLAHPRLGLNRCHGLFD